MAKTIIRLTENELIECVKNFLTELTYRQAALAHGANYNAQKDYEMNQRNNARDKMAKSKNITLDAITKSIIDNFPNLTMEFVEHDDNTNLSYPVDMNFQQIKYIDKTRVIF